MAKRTWTVCAKGSELRRWVSRKEAVRIAVMWSSLAVVQLPWIESSTGERQYLLPQRKAND